MQKGLDSRYTIHKILLKINKQSKNFDDVFEEQIGKFKFSQSDKKLIQNVVLNSMRNYLYIDQIIQNFTKKIDKNSHAYFLLLSAITQLIILNFKDFAVINSTVEISKNKKFKTSYGFINAVLRNIIKNKNKLDFKVKYEQLPNWFKKYTNLKYLQKQNFLETINKEPKIHIVYKSEKEFLDKKIEGFKTSKTSLLINKNHKIENLPKYKNGVWWIQDFGIMLPLYLIENIKGKEIVDLCAAPGGKTFQLLSEGGLVTAIDKNFSRLKIMKKNLKRLKMKCKILNKDVLNINTKKKFDMVILDAPCTSVGTIRRNPEIFFRKKSVNIDKLLIMQKNLLEKTKLFVKKNGIIVYIVCSFLKAEGIMQINDFLKRNKNFKILKYNSKKLPLSKAFIDNNGYISSYPTIIDEKILIDGFFAAKLIKND